MLRRDEEKMTLSEIIFCSECGNMIEKIVKEEGKIFGVCSNGHKNPLNNSALSKLSKLLGTTKLKNLLGPSSTKN